MSHNHLPLFVLHADGATLLAQIPSAPPVAGEGSQPAQSSTGENGSPLGQSGTPTQPSASPFGGNFLFILLAFMLFMIMMSVLSGRKEKKRRREMLSAIGRHDRVMMTGGMIGTISEIRDDEVVVKVDESNNTRIHFSRSAIQSVLKSAGGGAESDDQLAEADNS